MISEANIHPFHFKVTSWRGLTRPNTTGIDFKAQLTKANEEIHSPFFFILVTPLHFREGLI
jgi:hypothetical protein